MRYEITGRNRAFNPFNAFVDLEREFGKLWGTTARGESKEWTWSPKVDVRERDEHWLLSIDVPGVAREDIKVDIVNDQLVVTGERHFEREEKAYSERSYGKFERRFNLPENIEISKIEASYSNGVLNLVVPKVLAAKPTTVAIDVKEGSDTLFNELLTIGKKTENKEIN